MQSLHAIKFVFCLVYKYVCLTEIMNTSVQKIRSKISLQVLSSVLFYTDFILLFSSFFWLSIFEGYVAVYFEYKCSGFGFKFSFCDYHYFQRYEISFLNALLSYLYHMVRQHCSFPSLLASAASKETTAKSISL